MRTSFRKLFLVLTVAIIAISTSTQCQEKVLLFTGSVIDATTKQELPGVTILDKTTEYGVITDQNGGFKISLSSYWRDVKAISD